MFSDLGGALPDRTAWFSDVFGLNQAVQRVGKGAITIKAIRKVSGAHRRSSGFFN